MLVLYTKCWQSILTLKFNKLSFVNTLVANWNASLGVIGLTVLKPKPTLTDLFPVTFSNEATILPVTLFIICRVYIFVVLPAVGCTSVSNVKPSGCPPVWLSLKV